MIDPANITNYNLSDLELEEHILWWVCAAGKNGTVASKNLHKLLTMVDGYRLGPFLSIRNWAQDLPLTLQNCGIGCYNHKARTILELVYSDLDLRNCMAKDLENIYGIGMKTSRCFILHSRKGARYAGLDTHILKFLRMNGIDAPKSTPTSKSQYMYLEQEFLKLADEANKTPAEFDLEIWNKYSIKPRGKEDEPTDDYILFMRK